MRGNKHFLSPLYNRSDILLHFPTDSQVPDGCLLLWNLIQVPSQKQLDKYFTEQKTSVSKMEQRWRATLKLFIDSYVQTGVKLFVLKKPSVEKWSYPPHSNHALSSTKSHICENALEFHFFHVKSHSFSLLRELEVFLSNLQIAN